MLKNEKTSNNESDSAYTLLTISGIQRLTFENEGFVLCPEQVLSALSQPCSLFEDQALQYFSGYIVKKVIDKFHGKNSICDICQHFGKKITCKTRSFRDNELFIYIKKYDDDHSAMYSCSDEFRTFAQNVSFLS